jgi:hypothetical protein
VVTNITIFWDIAPGIRYVNRCFGGNHGVNLQGRITVKKKHACNRWLGNFKMLSALSE